VRYISEINIASIVIVQDKPIIDNCQHIVDLKSYHNIVNSQSPLRLTHRVSVAYGVHRHILDRWSNLVEKNAQGRAIIDTDNFHGKLCMTQKNNGIWLFRGFGIFHEGNLKRLKTKIA
jgi:hypothetical protein